MEKVEQLVQRHELMLHLHVLCAAEENRASKGRLGGVLFELFRERGAPTDQLLQLLGVHDAWIIGTPCSTNNPWESLRSSLGDDL